MSLRRNLLKTVYPLYLQLARLSGRHRKVLENKGGVRPQQSLYTLDLTLTDGSRISMTRYIGRKLLLVNTASDCIYTDQYQALQQLYTQMADELSIIGFPANDFREQERGSDSEVAAFCQTQYGLAFPLARKAPVVGAGQQPVFRWLTDPAQNGWNRQAPTWNFAKYLVDEEGMLTHYFDPAITPADPAFRRALGLQ